MYQAPVRIKADASIRRLVGAAFPSYRGRKYRIKADDGPVDVRSYWDGGTRDYFVILDLGSLRSMGVPQNGTPFDGGPIRPEGVEIPPGFAIVEHSIFCGKDVGITIHINPVDMPRYLTA